MYTVSNVVKLYKPSEYKRYQHEKTKGYVDSAYFIEIVDPDSLDYVYFKLGHNHDGFVVGNDDE